MPIIIGIIAVLFTIWVFYAIFHAIFVVISHNRQSNKAKRCHKSESDFSRVNSSEELNREAEKKKLVEKTGMDAAFSYLSNSGLSYTDVSSKNLGYDISFVKDGIEYMMEVKALSGYGDISLTYNEYEALKHLGSRFVLFILMYATSYTHTKYVIDNPNDNIKITYNSSTDRYIVNYYDIIRYRS
jgi:hypothetical protein